MSRRRQDNTPAALGAELTDAAAAYETTKRSVIDRGLARVADLRALENEARDERLLLEELVNQA